jgi:hypothetical protein
MEKTVSLQPNAFLVNVDGKNYSNCDVLGSFYDVVYKNEMKEENKVKDKDKYNSKERNRNPKHFS